MSNGTSYRTLGIKHIQTRGIALPNPLGDASEARAGAAGAVVLSRGALAGVTACCASKVENPCKPKRSNEWLPNRDDPIYLQ